MNKTYLSLLISVLLFSCTINISKESKKAENKMPNKAIANQLNMNNDKKTIEFPSKDGLLITADLYEVKNSKNFILLCHQAGFSRGEYKDTAIKLNALGYSCLAIDQRSGDSANKIINETAKRAKEKKLPTTYIDAKQDIEAAVAYAYNLNNNKPIIIVGSSYSASLVLLVATTNNKVKAVASFSPGEYLKPIQVAVSTKTLNKPVFVTSSKSEIAQTASIIKEMQSKNKIHFKPEVQGIHGSRALWESTKGNATYWSAFTAFLKSLD